MSCFYNNYNYNLNNQLSTFGTASRIGGLFAGSNTNVFGNIFGNGFGGYGNYGMFGGFGNYGMFGGFNNCGCGMSPWAQIGYTFGNIAATFLGMWGMSALSNKIQSSLAEKRQPTNVDTKESVGKELKAQLKILGLQDKTVDEVANNTNLIEKVGIADSYQTKIDGINKEIADAKARVENTTSGLEATKTSRDANIKRKDELIAKQNNGTITDQEKTDLEDIKKTIKVQNDQIKELEALKASYEENGTLDKNLKAAEKEKADAEEKIKTAKGEAKDLVKKYNDFVEAEKKEAEAKAKAEEEAAASKAKAENTEAINNRNKLNKLIDKTDDKVDGKVSNNVSDNDYSAKYEVKDGKVNYKQTCENKTSTIDEAKHAADKLLKATTKVDIENAKAEFRFICEQIGQEELNKYPHIAKLYSKLK